MSTTLLHPPHSSVHARESKTVRRDPSVPRHVALVLRAASSGQSPALQTASAVLRAIVAGCAECGIDVLTVIPPDGEKEIFEAAIASIEPPGLTLNVSSALDGRAELLDAVRRLSAQAQSGHLAPERIDAHAIESLLSTRGLPPVDLLIATGGGEKLCGALLWQCAYAELLFLDIPWFVITRAHLNAALADYATRCRKFGGLG